MSQSTNDPSSKARRMPPAGSDGHPDENRAGSETPAEISTREVQYMMGQRQGDGVSPLRSGGAAAEFDTGRMLAALSALPDCKVVRVVKQSRLEALSARPSSFNSDILVVRTADRERARQIELMAQRNPGLVVERDRLLHHLGAFRPQFAPPPRGPSQITTVAVPVRFHVQYSDGRPVANAEIVAYDDTGSEDQGKTDAMGNATVAVSGGFVNQTAALYVKPAANYWENFVERLALDVNGANKVTLRALSALAQAKFPGDPFLG